MYHFNDLSIKTGLYGLIGDPVEKSLSQISHNSVMQQLNLSSVYVKYPVPPEQLSDFLTWAKKVGMRGMSVTMPLKEKVIESLDFVDPWAKKIGAVNTLVFEDGKIKGYNTDGKGALDAIEAQMKVKGKRIVFIGAGGACKAAAAESIERGAEAIILNRDEKRAMQLANLLGCESGVLNYMDQISRRGYDILVNTSPDPMPIDPEYMLKGKLVMDMELQPKNTAFLLKAKEKGCTVVYGYEMFINQAVLQFQLWFGNRVDSEKVRGIIQKAVLQNIQEV